MSKNPVLLPERQVSVLCRAQKTYLSNCTETNFEILLEIHDFEVIRKILFHEDPEKTN